MISEQNKTAFEKFAAGEIGYRRAVAMSEFDHYSPFLDAYFEAGYKYPLPPEEQLRREVDIVGRMYKLNQKGLRENE